MKDPIKY